MQTERPVNHCSARSSRSGQRCKRAPIAGGHVCRHHGGAAPQVRRKAAERLADLIDPGRVLREAARIAYFDPRKLFDASGNLLPVQQWPDDAAASVAGLEILKRGQQSGDGRSAVHKLRILDKTPALTLLFKHLGLLADRIDHHGEITYKWKD